MRAPFLTFRAGRYKREGGWSSRPLLVDLFPKEKKDQTYDEVHDCGD